MIQKVKRRFSQPKYMNAASPPSSQQQVKSPSQVYKECLDEEEELKAELERLKNSLLDRKYYCRVLSRGIDDINDKLQNLLEKSSRDDKESSHLHAKEALQEQAKKNEANLALKVEVLKRYNLYKSESVIGDLNSSTLQDIKNCAREFLPPGFTLSGTRSSAEDYVAFENIYNASTLSDGVFSIKDKEGAILGLEQSPLTKHGRLNSVNNEFSYEDGYRYDDSSSFDGDSRNSEFSSRNPMMPLPDSELTRKSKLLASAENEDTDDDEPEEDEESGHNSIDDERQENRGDNGDEGRMDRHEKSSKAVTCDLLSKERDDVEEANYLDLNCMEGICAAVFVNAILLERIREEIAKEQSHGQKLREEQNQLGASVTALTRDVNDKRQVLKLVQEAAKTSLLRAAEYSGNVSLPQKTRFYPPSPTSPPFSDIGDNENNSEIYDLRYPENIGTPQSPSLSEGQRKVSFMADINGDESRTSDVRRVLDEENDYREVHVHFHKETPKSFMGIVCDATSGGFTTVDEFLEEETSEESKNVEIEVTFPKYRPADTKSTPRTKARTSSFTACFANQESSIKYRVHVDVATDAYDSAEENVNDEEEEVYDNEDEEEEDRLFSTEHASSTPKGESSDPISCVFRSLWGL